MVAISVIVPVYNQEQYIRKCINTLQKQTFSDYEVILVDDGSTDSSNSVIRNEIKEDSRFKLIMQDNSGVSVARNNGIRTAAGEWLCFVDPDDYVDEKYLEHLIGETNDEFDVVMSSYYAVMDNGVYPQRFFPRSFIVQTDDDRIPLYHQLMDGSYAQSRDAITGIGVPWGKLYRKSFLKEHNLMFSSDLRRMQDNIFNMQVFHEARSIKYVTYMGYYYRVAGLGSRAYHSLANGVYHNVMRHRLELLTKYDLLQVPHLRMAFNKEQISLYFQEARAIIHVASLTGEGTWEQISDKFENIRRQICRVDYHDLSYKDKIKYVIIKNKILAIIIFRNMWLKGRKG